MHAFIQPASAGCTLAKHEMDEEDGGVALRITAHNVCKLIHTVVVVVVVVFVVGVDCASSSVNCNACSVLAAASAAT